MMSTLHHPLVVDYLARLEAAAASLPPDRRAELITDLGGHMEEAAAHTDGSEAAIRDILDRLGPPEDVAREAEATPGVGPQPAAGPPQPGRSSPVVEMWALGLFAASILFCVTVVLLPFAPVALVVALVLLAISRRWTRSDKLLGALAYGLGGLPLIIVVTSLPLLQWSSECHGGNTPDGTTWQECSGGAPAWLLWAAVAGVAALLALWITVGVRLYRSARGTVGRARPGWSGGAVAAAVVAVILVGLLLVSFAPLLVFGLRPGP